MRATTLREVRDGLRDVVNTERGTGKKARIKGFEVAGKTGTSQVVKMGKERLKAAQVPWQHRDHAWFVAYAPVDAPEIAVAAIVEHAEGGGGAVAAPVVRGGDPEICRVEEGTRETTSMLRIDRRLLAHFDWPLLACTLLVVGCGLMTVLSATHAPGRLVSGLVLRQATWAGIGLVGLLAALSFDYHWLERYGYFLYAGALLLLLATALLGASGGGARRWIGLGPFSIQPSEFAKLGLVIALARYLHRQVGDRTLALRSLVVPVVLLVPPAVLILKQPDLGTVIVLGLTVAAVLLVAGLRLRFVFLVVAVLVPAVPFLWQHLKPYQQRRVLTFVNPDADPLGAGYHIIQSKIAIGSGMLEGKGFLHGTQDRLNFLPEQHTDFIFRRLCGGVGVHRRGCVDHPLHGVALALFHGGDAGARRLRAAPRLRAHGGDLLSGRRQYRHGHRLAAGRRHYPAVPQLRRLVAPGQHARHRPADEHQHAAVHVLKDWFVRSVSRVELRPGTLSGSIGGIG